MNLWTDSGLKCAPETELQPDIERNHLHHRDMSKSVKYNTTSQWSHHTRLIEQSVQSEYNTWISEWFGTEMLTRNRIKIRYWKKPSASYRYVQISELQHYFPMIPSYTSHKDKVSNLNKINESLDWFGSEMSSRNRIKTRNWKKPSAS